MIQTKNIIAFLLALFAAPQAEASLENQKKFELAIDFAHKGKFDQAINQYLELPTNFTTLYNTASCFYAKGEFAHALLYLKKAEKYANFFEHLKLLKSIKQAKAKLGFIEEKQKKSVKLIKEALLLAKILFWSISTIWLEFFIILSWLGLMLTFKLAWRKRIKFLFGLNFLAIALGSFLANKWLQTANGIILTPKTMLSSGPSKHFLILEELKLGTEVKIQKQQGEYLKIQFDKKTGWIFGKNITKI